MYRLQELVQLEVTVVNTAKIEELLEQLVDHHQTIIDRLDTAVESLEALAATVSKLEKNDLDWSTKRSVARSLVDGLTEIERAIKMQE